MTDIFNPNQISTRSQHFVAGEWMSNQDQEIEVVRPSDREVQGMLCNGSESTVNQAVNAAHLAFAYSNPYIKNTTFVIFTQFFYHS